MKTFLKMLLSVLLMSTIIQASEEIPTKEEVAKLYVATFNRAPDSAGLSYWLNNSGLSLSGIAKSFFVQTETKALYPEGTTVRAFIQSVYQNLFNRAPDSGGLKYWEDDFNLRGRTRDSFILAMINGAKDNADGMDKTILNNKTTVGLSFSEAGLGDNDDAKDIMLGVSADEATVQAAVQNFGIALYNVEEENGEDDGTGSTVNHTFIEGISLDISNGITSNSMISLYQNSNENIEMYFTIGVNGTATVQYLENRQLVWQNTLYDYTVSGNTLFFSLQDNAEELDLGLGLKHVVQNITLTVASSTISAHDTATINGVTYTVVSAFSDGSVGDLIGQLQGF